MSITIERPARADRPRRTRRLVTGLVSTALATAGLSLATAPARAAETGTVTAGTATWGLSAYLNSPNPGRVNPLATAYGAPATFDSATSISTWGAPTGKVDTDGSATITFAGRSVNFASTAGSWLRLSDAKATLDASGNGTLSAVVEYGTSTTGSLGNFQYVPAQVGDRPAERVTLTHLVGNTSADLTRTRSSAKWTGLRSTAWAPEFIDFLDGDTAQSYPSWTFLTGVTGSTTSGPRPPLPLTIAVTTEEAKITSAVTTSTADSVTVAVSGSGYRPAGAPPKFGVYAAVVEAGTTDLTDQNKMLGAIWTESPGNPAFKIQPDGTFAATLTLTAADLATMDRNKNYSVFTFGAHGTNVADPSQTVEKPITIDFSGFPKKTSTPAVTTSASVVGRSSTVTVSVPTVGQFAPTGAITLTGAGTQSAVLANGTATFSLPATLAAGTTTLTAAYTGDANYVGASASATRSVSKATVTVRRNKISKKPTTKKTGRTTLTVRSATGVAVDGKVKVTFTKKGQKTKSKTVTVRNGAATVTIPKLRKGTWKIATTYAGTASFDRTATQKAGTVKVTK